MIRSDKPGLEEQDLRPRFKEDLLMNPESSDNILSRTVFQDLTGIGISLFRTKLTQGNAL